MKRVLAVAIFFLIAVPVVFAKHKPQPITVEVFSTQTRLHASSYNGLLETAVEYGVAVYAVDAATGKHVLYSCAERVVNRCEYIENGVRLVGTQAGDEVEFTFADEKKPVRYRAQGSW